MKKRRGYALDRRVWIAVTSLLCITQCGVKGFKSPVEELHQFKEVEPWKNTTPTGDLPEYELTLGTLFPSRLTLEPTLAEEPGDETRRKLTRPTVTSTPEVDLESETTSREDSLQSVSPTLKADTESETKTSDDTTLQTVFPTHVTDTASETSPSDETPLQTVFPTLPADPGSETKLSDEATLITAFSTPTTDRTRPTEPTTQSMYPQRTTHTLDEDINMTGNET